MKHLRPVRSRQTPGTLPDMLKAALATALIAFAGRLANDLYDAALGDD